MTTMARPRGIEPTEQYGYRKWDEISITDFDGNEVTEKPQWNEVKLLATDHITGLCAVETIRKVAERQFEEAYYLIQSIDLDFREVVLVEYQCWKCPKWHEATYDSLEEAMKSARDIGMSVREPNSGVMLWEGEAANV